MTVEATANTIDVNFLVERLADAEIPGHYAVFTDEEAAYLGAFEEDAITEESAFAGSYHNPGIIAEVERELRG